MLVKLNRKSSVQSVTIADSGTTSGVVTLDGFAMGMVMLPSTFDGTSLQFTVCDTYGGTYVGLEDSAGNAVALVVEASKAYALPESLFGAPYAKLVASSQTGASIITVTLKA